jgi:uncharacterized protein YraI
MRTLLKEARFSLQGGSKIDEAKMRRSLGFLGGAAFLLLTTSSGFARPATVSTDLNVRAGQGSEYSVTGVIPAGTLVDVTGCGDGWCYVRDYGGFASARYMDVGRTVYRRGYDAYAYAPVPVYAPRIHFGFGFSRSDPWWGWY